MSLATTDAPSESSFAPLFRSLEWTLDSGSFSPTISWNNLQVLYRSVAIGSRLSLVNDENPRYDESEFSQSIARYCRCLEEVRAQNYERFPSAAEVFSLFLTWSAHDLRQKNRSVSSLECTTVAEDSTGKGSFFIIDGAEKDPFFARDVFSGNANVTQSEYALIECMFQARAVPVDNVLWRQGPKLSLIDSYQSWAEGKPVIVASMTLPEPVATANRGSLSINGMDDEFAKALFGVDKQTIEYFTLADDGPSNDVRYRRPTSPRLQMPVHIPETQFGRMRLLGQLRSEANEQRNRELSTGLAAHQLRQTLYPRIFLPKQEFMEPLVMMSPMKFYTFRDAPYFTTFGVRQKKE